MGSGKIIDSSKIKKSDDKEWRKYYELQCTELRQKCAALEMALKYCLEELKECNAVAVLPRLKRQAIHTNILTIIDEALSGSKLAELFQALLEYFPQSIECSEDGSNLFEKVENLKKECGIDR